jgi:hypothetical protein
VHHFLPVEAVEVTFHHAGSTAYHDPNAHFLDRFCNVNSWFVMQTEELSVSCSLSLGCDMCTGIIPSAAAVIAAKSDIQKKLVVSNSTKEEHR